MFSRAFRVLPHPLQVYINNNNNVAEPAPFISRADPFGPVEQLDQKDIEWGDATLSAERDAHDLLSSPKHQHCINESQHDQPLVSSHIVATQRWSPLSTYVDRFRNEILLKSRHCNTSDKSCSNTRTWLPSTSRRVLKLLIIVLMLLGLLHLLVFLCGVLLAFFPEEVDWSKGKWTVGSSPPNDLNRWQGDIVTDSKPVACHSHNDYWRKQPLFSAIKAGCTGVEPDVWLFNNDLYVGHHTSDLVAGRTLQSLYIQPLLDLLESRNQAAAVSHGAIGTPRNGVFLDRPRQTLVFLIDFKNEGRMVWDLVNKQLEPLRQRGYLSHYNGRTVVQAPVTVVVSGEAPFDRVIANSTYRDIFFDAPLDAMAATTTTANPATSSANANLSQGRSLTGSAALNPSIYSPANSYYASVSFKRSIGWPWRSGLTEEQVNLVRAQIAGAHARGLKVRYWSVPEWPRGLRNYLWRFLIEEGVDVLNVNSLRAATRINWRPEEKGHRPTRHE